MIFEKYVAIGSIFEINLSCRLRKVVIVKFVEYHKLFLSKYRQEMFALHGLKSLHLEYEDMKNERNFSGVDIGENDPEFQQSLKIVFDTCAKEIENLMHDSYIRFRQTREYHKLLKKLVKLRRKRSKLYLVFGKNKNVNDQKTGMPITPL